MKSICSNWLLGASVVLAIAAPAAAQTVDSKAQERKIVDPTFVNDAFVGDQIRYESVNRGEPGGDKLAEARRIAAAVVAQDRPNPAKIVDVGSHAGEFLEAFLEQFPSSNAQWTEPVEDNHANAIRRFARFRNKIDYVIGCPNRDLSLGCVPKGTDVLITSWLTIHQNLPGIRKFYKEAAAILPSGGWVANIDHVAVRSGNWTSVLGGARKTLKSEAIAAQQEGPGVHHLDYVLPTLEDQLAALRAAGFTDPQVVWRRLDTVLIVARKP
ncbi:hypothetical protein H7F51_05320 [Novosphingobium flavum]|uniref:Methyltransferase domain-containing protein n=1 Tax=Novosphingobium flavum TaxID=1778672 RepID=A0A7X1FQ56_9SPHN|nr:class I SAM-dependent methyltransferase [Novosphingobium flavum]MBC2664930.1 hypothetical protein [Novosphingobium flavum]